MSYIDKNNNTALGSILEVGVIRNAKGQTANSYLSVCTLLNVTTNTLSSLSYTVECFENKETLGYFYKTYTNYAEAKKAYDDLSLNHVEEVK